MISGRCSDSGQQTSAVLFVELNQNQLVDHVILCICRHWCKMIYFNLVTFSKIHLFWRQKNKTFASEPVFCWNRSFIDLFYRLIRSNQENKTHPTEEDLNYPPLLLLILFLVLVSSCSSNSLNIKHLLPLSLVTTVLKMDLPLHPIPQLHRSCRCHGDNNPLVISVNYHHGNTISSSVIREVRGRKRRRKNLCRLKHIHFFPFFFFLLGPTRPDSILVSGSVTCLTRQNQLVRFLPTDSQWFWSLDVILSGWHHFSFQF